MSTLAEKVRAQFDGDDMSDALHSGLKSRPEWGGPLSELEMDIRDWGMVYGIAYGIARAEDPFESGQSVAARAAEAAKVAYAADWGGHMAHPPDRDEELRRIRESYDRFDAVLPRSEDPQLDAELLALNSAIVGACSRLAVR